jgi:hypothetical protein
MFRWDSSPSFAVTRPSSVSRDKLLDIGKLKYISNRTVCTRCLVTVTSIDFVFVLLQSHFRKGVFKDTEEEKTWTLDGGSNRSTEKIV